MKSLFVSLLFVMLLSACGKNEVPSALSAEANLFTSLALDKSAVKSVAETSDAAAATKPDYRSGIKGQTLASECPISAPNCPGALFFIATELSIQRVLPRCSPGEAGCPVPPSILVKTDSKGLFSVALDAGSYLIASADPGYQFPAQSVTVKFNEYVSKTIVGSVVAHAPKSGIKGTTLVSECPANAPKCPGALFPVSTVLSIEEVLSRCPPKEICLAPVRSHQVKTDLNGQFSVELDPGSYRISSADPGYQFVSLLVTVNPNQYASEFIIGSRVEKPPRTGIEGSAFLFGCGAQPPPGVSCKPSKLPGLSVQIVSISDRGLIETPDRLIKVVTDSSGRFFAVVPAGKYEVSCAACVVSPSIVTVVPKEVSNVTIDVLAP